MNDDTDDKSDRLRALDFATRIVWADDDIRGESVIDRARRFAAFLRQGGDQGLKVPPAFRD